ncbi:hypothetical protein JCM10207_002483 [Rhodosporidiobolus poonsookiae]
MATLDVAGPLSGLSLSSAANEPHSSSSSAGYLDLRFPLPERAYVGMLACQRDPLLRTLTTKVTRCTKVEAPPPAPSKGKKAKPVEAAPPAPSKGKKAKPVEAAPATEEWDLELLDTVLFPEGGGQPSDTGFIIPLLDGKDGMKVAVTSVRRVNLDAVHRVERPVEVGTEVRVEVDWERREDLMQQHSGQHLLSAIFDTLDLDTLSWSLTKYPELCYVELPRAPTPSELGSVQKRVNALIAEGRRVRVKMELVTKENDVKLGEKVPTNYSADETGQERPPVNRTVFIDGIDENPCCGTHFPSLSYLSFLFLSPYTTPIRSTNARVYFAFGSRALAHLSSTFTHARDAALAAGCAVPDLQDKVAGLVQGQVESKRREKRLKEELAGLVAREVLERANASAAGGVQSALCFREDDATNALDFLASIAGELGTLAPPSPQGAQLFLLACGATSGSAHAAAAGGAVLITGSDALVVEAGKRVVEVFGKERVRGGGKGRWQGKVTGRWEAGDEVLLRRIVEEVAGGGKA